MLFLAVGSLALNVLILSLYVFSEIYHSRERENLMRAVLSKHLGQYSYAKVIEKNRVPTVEDHQQFTEQLRAPEAPRDRPPPPLPEEMTEGLY
jgi:hypothetical protein